LKENAMSDVKETVRSKYAEAAKAVTGADEGCCGTKKACCGEESKTRLYDAGQVEELPEKAVLASLGCGNPTALAELKAGETVLDLGSGGGIDVLLSARRVGPTGMAYGLDMTDEMLTLASENKARAGLSNVIFLKGEIEAIPLPANSVDVVISNCVINLSGDKDKVLAEAFRVLKPGGRFAVTDIVVRGEVPDEIKGNALLWAGCVSGAMQESEYAAKLAAAGFTAIAVEAIRVYEAEVARDWFKNKGVDFDSVAPYIDKKFVSAFVRAVKPRESCCCGGQ
jgi:arsenite methyltransferase